MLQVPDSGMFESLNLVVHKSTNRQPQRNYRDGRRRFKPRDDPNEVANQNEKTERHQKRRETLAVMPDDFLTLVFDESVGTLEDVLQCGRLVDGKPRSHEHE